MNITYQEAYLVSVYFIVIYCLLNSISLLLNLKSYNKNNVFSEDILTENPKLARLSFLNKKIFNFQNFRNILLIRIVVSLLILCYPDSKFIIILFIIQNYLYYRNFIHSNAADRFAITILLGLSLFSVLSNPIMKEFSLIFIALSSLLSFLFAAYHKIISVYWRNGTGLSGVFTTDTFGSEFLYELSQNIFLCLVLSWIIIIFQFFSIFSILSPKICLIYLLLCSLFHIFNNLVLRVEGFLWVYFSTFPCIYYLSILISNIN